MAYSRINYVGNGSQHQYAINFPLGFLNRGDVTCYVLGEVDGLGAQVYRTLTWIDDGLVDVGSAPANSATVVFERTVDKDELIHDYADGSGIVEENLDQSNKQNIMLVHEVLDGRFGVLQNDIDLGQFTVTNVADPVDPQDVVNLRYFEANNALANRLAAEAAQAAAELAEDGAVAAKLTADADAASALANKNTAVAAAASATADAVSTAADRSAVAADKATVATDKATVTTLANQVATDASQVATNTSTVVTNTATVVADAAQVAADKLTVASDKASTHADKLAADASAAAAAASAASIALPNSVGQGTNYIRQKADESGFEYRTPAQVLADIGAPTSANLQAVLDVAVSAYIKADVAASDTAGVYGRVLSDDFESDTLATKTNAVYNATTKLYDGYAAASTSYANAKGSGNRSGQISIVSHTGWSTAPTAALWDGSTAGTYANVVTGNASGISVVLDFGTAVCFDTWRTYCDSPWPANTFVWQGSDSSSGPWTDVCAPFNYTTVSGWSEMVLSPTSGGVSPTDRAYRYFKVVGLTGTSLQSGVFHYEWEFKITATANSATNMTLIPNATALAAEPNDASVYVLREDAVAVTNGTDFLVDGSVDGGATWAAASAYTVVGSYGSADKLVRADINVASQTGTSFKWRIRTLNTKRQKVKQVTAYTA